MFSFNRNACATNTDFEYNYDFFAAIYSAIKNNSDEEVDVKTELGEELILTLDQIHFDYYSSNMKSFNTEYVEMYDEMIDILGFNLITIERKSPVV